MANHKNSVNRFGKDVTTAIPDNAPLAKQPGHKLRTSNSIVDRSALHTMDNDHASPMTSSAGQAKTTDVQTIELVQFENQVGLIRKRSDDHADQKMPNMFSGPSFRNQQQRFRFDGHKMLHHLDRVLAWQKGEKIAPIHIDMGLTKYCNTACLYCYAVVQNMTKGKMIAREPLLNFIEDCGRLGVRSLGFIGDGEPTLNPALYDATVLAASHGIDTSMATNGLLLDMDRAHDVLANMSWVRFNLSAGSAAGFQKVHQSKAKNFDLLIDKIRSLVQLKKQHGYQCTIGLQMVLIPECFDEVIAEAKLGQELGVDYFVIKHCSDSEYKEIGVNYDDYQRAAEKLKCAESYSNDEYVVQVKWNKINANSETDLYKNGYRKYDVCMGTPFLLQISGNGKIYPCGPFFNKERFYMGDLHEHSFYELVQSDHYWAVHQDITNSVDVHKDCAIGCRQDYINKFLWDLKSPPEHVNFI